MHMECLWHAHFRLVASLPSCCWACSLSSRSPRLAREGFDRARRSSVLPDVLLVRHHAWRRACTARVGVSQAPGPLQADLASQSISEVGQARSRSPRGGRPFSVFPAEEEVRSCDQGEKKLSTWASKALAARILTKPSPSRYYPGKEDSSSCGGSGRRTSMSVD